MMNTGKKAYRRPSLLEYGTVRDLVLGAECGCNDDFMGSWS